MRETVTPTGIILISTPSGDYDGGLVLLAREREWIAALSHGIRKPGNALMAASRPFSLGTFSMYGRRPAYNLQSAQITSYSGKLSMDMERTCYGSYFLEIADYFSQENMDGTEMLKLLYQSLRALLKSAIPNRLMRRTFELKAMVINGEYAETPPPPVSESCNYAWEYVACSPVETLYKSVLKEGVMREFDGVVDKNGKCYVHHEPKSLEILGMLTA